MSLQSSGLIPGMLARHVFKSSIAHHVVAGQRRIGSHSQGTCPLRALERIFDDDGITSDHARPINLPQLVHHPRNGEHVGHDVTVLRVSVPIESWNSMDDDWRAQINDTKYLAWISSKAEPPAC